MSEGIKELDELHAVGQELLDALCEIVDLSERLAERYAEKKHPTKAMRTEIGKRVEDWRSLSDCYRELTREDRFIKVWWLLQDTLIDVHMAEASRCECPVWGLTDAQGTLHCHDALRELSNTLLSSRLSPSEEPSLRRFATLASDDSLSIVSGDLFAHFFDSEIAAARKQLLQRGDEEFPFCAVTRFCARRECLRKMTEHARGCLELARTFVRIKGMQQHWSKSTYVATRQAEDRWDRVEKHALRIATHTWRFREVPNSLELLDWIRKANVEHLKEVVVQGKPFATAHESIEWLEQVIDNAIGECDGLTEQENVDELTEIVSQIEIPDLDALLLIEQERTLKWLDLKFKEERAHEEQDEAAAERRRSLDEHERQIEEQEETEVDDLAEHLERPAKSRKRNQGRPPKREDPEEMALESRFWSVYKKLGLKEACRECGIDQDYGKKLKSRLRTRDYRDRQKAEQERPNSP